MKASIRNQLRLISSRLDALDPKGTQYVVMHENDPESKLEQVRADHPGCPLSVIRIQHESPA